MSSNVGLCFIKQASQRRSSINGVVSLTIPLAETAAVSEQSLLRGARAAIDEYKRSHGGGNLAAVSVNNYQYTHHEDSSRMFTVDVVVAADSQETISDFENWHSTTENAGLDQSEAMEPSMETAVSDYPASQSWNTPTQFEPSYF